MKPQATIFVFITALLLAPLAPASFITEAANLVELGVDLNNVFVIAQNVSVAEGATVDIQVDKNAFNQWYDNTQPQWIILKIDTSNNVATGTFSMSISYAQYNFTASNNIGYVYYWPVWGYYNHSGVLRLADSIVISISFTSDGTLDETLIINEISFIPVVDPPQELPTIIVEAPQAPAGGPEELSVDVEMPEVEMSELLWLALGAGVAALAVMAIAMTARER